MGKFLQKLDDLTFKQSSGTNFIICNELTFISDSGRKITVPDGYKTNFYSNPIEENTAVDVRPACLHDYCCQNKGYYYKGKFYSLTFKEANDLFFEAMKSVNIPWWKCLIYRIAVNFNPNRW